MGNMMLNNYIKTTFRNLIRSKGYTVINILGLAIGLSASILILLFIVNELSYDKFFKDSERIYRIAVKGRMSGDFFDVAVTPSPMAPALKHAFPEVESSVRLRQWSQQSLFAYEHKMFYEKDVFFADSSFFDIFDFKPAIGDLKTALYEPFSAVLTQEIAHKYFGTDNPIGKILKVNDAFQFKVTAVIEDIPENTHLKFPLLLSWSSIKKMNDSRMDDNWGSLGFYTYVKLAENTDSQLFESKIKTFIIDNLIEQSGEDSSRFENVQLEFKPYLQAIENIHLHSNLMAELAPNSDISYIYSFSAIAAFILLIACINFMNLTTARSAKRAREVGIRKVHGGFRSQLIAQFIGESVILSFIALVIAVILVELTIPVFSDIIGQHISEDLLINPLMIISYLILAILVGFVAGSYPAFYLSSFQPVNVLKRNLTRSSKNSTLRNALVIIQFSISIFLIVGTGIIYNQLSYVKNKKLGFDKEQVMILQLRSEKLREKSAFLENEFRKLSVVENAAASTSIPGEGSDGSAFFPEGESTTDPWLIFNTGADYDYIETMGMEIIKGRSFSKEFTSDTAGIIINETLLKKLGWGDDCIGKKLTPGDPENKFSFHVIGVVKDFHFLSLHDKIEPYIIYLSKNNLRTLSIKIKSGDLNESIEKISNKWSEMEPNFPFDYQFLEETFDELYKSEERLGKLFIYFSIIAIFIACLGLFGLASYTAEQRTKEIGIRKTFGATTPSISLLLTRDFTKWILLANILAWPSAYYFLGLWLENFAFRINITDQWHVFVLSAIISFAVALLTVSLQAIKVAHSNPVDALKYE
jgi:putative ABC transport system permease protein